MYIQILVHFAVFLVALLLAQASVGPKNSSVVNGSPADSFTTRWISPTTKESASWTGSLKLKHIVGAGLPTDSKPPSRVEPSLSVLSGSADHSTVDLAPGSTAESSGSALASLKLASSSFPSFSTGSTPPLISEVTPTDSVPSNLAFKATPSAFVSPISSSRIRTMASPNSPSVSETPGSALKAKTSSNMNAASTTTSSIWPSETVITINGLTFLKPNDTITFPQLEGGSWVLAPNYVICGTEKYPFPTSNVSQIIQLKPSSGGRSSDTVFLSPGTPIQKPDVGGLTGVPAAKKAIQDISLIAKSMSRDMNNVLRDGQSYAMNTMSESAFITSVQSKLDTLASQLRSLSSAVNNIEGTLKHELDGLSSAERSHFDSVATSIRDSLNCNEYYFDLVRNLASSKGIQLQKLQLLLKQVLKPGVSGVRQKYAQGCTSINLFGAMPFTLDPAGSSLSNASTIGRTTSSSKVTVDRRTLESASTHVPRSPGSDNPTETPSSFMLLTVYGTSSEDFQALIHRIDGAKSKRQLDNGYWQSYVTDLTPSQADHIRQTEGIVAAIDSSKVHVDWNRALVSHDNTGGNRSVSPHSDSDNKSIEKRLNFRDPNNRQMVLELPASRDYAQFLSQDPKYARQRVKSNPGSFWHESLGKGSRVYIIDSGFRMTHSELTTRPGPTRSFWVPNFRTGGNAPEDMADYAFDGAGHGTSVAAVVGGATRGVAPNAELVLIKCTNGIWTPYGYQLPWPLEIEGFAAAFDHIIKDFANKQRPPPRKTVVNLSMNSFLEDEFLLSSLFQAFFRWTAQNDVVFVNSAGNRGNSLNRIGMPYNLADSYPTCMGSPDNQIITVGGLNQDGSLWWETTPQIGYIGDMTVYAVAENIKTAAAYGDDAWVTTDGNSFAAATISAMIGYWLALPDQQTRWRTSQDFLMDVKNQLRNQAWPRRKAFIRTDTPHVNYPLPASAPGGYNMAWGDYCGPGHGDARRARRDADSDDPNWPACSLGTNAGVFELSINSSFSNNSSESDEARTGLASTFSSTTSNNSINFPTSPTSV